MALTFGKGTIKEKKKPFTGAFYPKEARKIAVKSSVDKENKCVYSTLKRSKEIQEAFIRGMCGWMYQQGSCSGTPPRGSFFIS